MFTRKITAIPVIMLMLLAFACGPKPIAPQAELDTPLHHVNVGHKLLKAGKLDDALREFTQAMRLDPKYSPAYVGLGLVYGYKAQYDKTIDHLKKADKYAEGKEQEANVHIGYMRVLTMGKEQVDDDWLDETESHFKKAISRTPDDAQPYYYMGLGYKMAYEFDKAAVQFSKVLDLNRDFVAEADKEYALIQQIQRSMPGSVNGKRIALVSKITRADAAALFIEELELEDLYKKRTLKKFDTSFKSPEKEFKTGEWVNIPKATDIADHVLKADIEAAMALGIKGLQPSPDHKFEPYKYITRAEFAIMIEDILIKITGDQKLATAFIGGTSPFPDLRSDLPYYNAVMVCTTRGIMHAQDLSSGEFNPMGTISGAQALLSIRALKNQL